MRRRDFLKLAGASALAPEIIETSATAAGPNARDDPDPSGHSTARANRLISLLFLCGDVMTGRGIDQILPRPVDPRIYESYMKSAKGYVKLAEDVNGRIPQPADYAYVWGDALTELRHRRPDARIINLETAVTTSGKYWAGKGINYRMHPANIPCLTAAAIDCCVLANNHVLDWGYAGLTDTLTTLARANVKTTGAGETLTSARAPTIIEIGGKGRVLVFGLGDASSGIPWAWGAGKDKAGVNLLADLSEDTVRRVAEHIARHKRANDVVVASIHWGGNWGYTVPADHRQFAHSLIERAQVDIVHGHSSHHPKGIELYRGKPILYGCGDFLNDYEGIAGYEEFRDDLSLMYFVNMDPVTGRLASLIMTPMQIRRFRLNDASPQNIRWLHSVLDRESRKLGTRVEPVDERQLGLVLGA